MFTTAEEVFGNGVSNSFYDEARGLIYFSAGAWLAALSVQDLRFHFLSHESTTAFLATDADYLYYNSAYLVYAVKKLALDTPPLYVMDHRVLDE